MLTRLQMYSFTLISNLTLYLSILLVQRWLTTRQIYLIPHWQMPFLRLNMTWMLYHSQATLTQYWTCMRNCSVQFEQHVSKMQTMFANTIYYYTLTHVHECKWFYIYIKSTTMQMRTHYSYRNYQRILRLSSANIECLRQNMICEIRTSAFKIIWTRRTRNVTSTVKLEKFQCITTIYFQFDELSFILNHCATNKSCAQKRKRQSHTT